MKNFIMDNCPLIKKQNNFHIIVKKPLKIFVYNKKYISYINI